MMKTKRCLVLLIMALMLPALLAGCNTSTSNDSQSSSTPSDSTSAPVGAIMALEDFPLMDGSTANLPLMAQILSDVCGISLDAAEQEISCRGTSQAWLALAKNDNCDILLVYEAAEVTKDELDHLGTELEVTPIGRDALVFICNADNPLDNITTQQLIDIYTGKVTNWSQIGGNDEEIVAYQRNETSGSQSLFMKLLMRGKTPMDPPTELKPGGMGQLIDELAAYNNTSNAIGYSVYYYASYMYSQPGLKFLSVDGIAPTEETIGNGAYPFINEYFAAIRADEPENSQTRILYNWIRGENGRQAIINSGYIPIS